MYNHHYTGAGGFTVSYRRKWTHPVFRNLLEAGIWAWMCDSAVWEPEGRSVRFAGKLYHLQRGQLVTSRSFIAAGFCISEQSTRTLLANMQKSGMINQQGNQRGTIITICNYGKYQDYPQEANQRGNQQPTSSQPASHHNINNKQRNKKTTSPHTPQGGVRFVEKGDDGSGNVTEREQSAGYDISRHLTDKDLEGVRAAAPGWCKYALMSRYNENVRTGGMQPPKYPAKAFVAWCRAYTKGERPA